MKRASRWNDERTGGDERKSKQRGDVVRSHGSPLVSRGAGVVAPARFCFVILVGHIQSELAEGSVGLFIGRIIAERIFGAKFFGNIVEGGLQALRVVDVNGVAAGIFGEIFRDGEIGVLFAAVTTSIWMSVSACCADSTACVDGDGTAVIGCVGEDDEDSTRGLRRHQVVRCEVDCVEEVGAATAETSAASAAPTISVTWELAGAAISVCRAAGADAGVTNCALECMHVAAPVGENGGSGSKAMTKALSSFVKDAMQKFGGGLLFGANHIGFAAAGVNQKADGERQSFFAGEERNFLFDVVLENSEIILIEVGHDGFLFVVERWRKDLREERRRGWLGFARAWRGGLFHRKGEQTAGCEC